ncbi:MAG: redoxin family protein [Gemmatimonadaceae bacterium]|nr:redoxin family protein [Gemmatimonadaceae bacterium]
MADRGTRVLQVLLVVAVVLVGVLSVEVQALKPYQAQARRMRSFPHIGQWFPRTNLVTEKGDSLTIGETTSGRAQVVIFFRTTCPYCLASLPAWKSMSDSLMKDQRSRFDVIWITGSNWDSTASYAAKHNLNYAIGQFVDTKMPMVLKARVVPLTVILDRFGRVEYVHVQAVTERSTVDSLYSAAFRAAAADSMLTAAGSASR